MATKVKKSNQEFTGRYIVMTDPNLNAEDSIFQLQSLTGLRVKNSTEFVNEIFTDSDIKNEDGIYLDKLGIAIVNDIPKNKTSISTLQTSSEFIVEPERYVEAIEKEETMVDYIKGYRDATNSLADTILGKDSEVDTEMMAYEENVYEIEQDIETETTNTTWGLKSTKVSGNRFPFYRNTRYTGRGIKVAVLDTGFEFQHPDFNGRTILNRSFVPGEAAQDGHGHGTHCTGTACGPLRPNDTDERYGVAYKSSIYIGKVLNNAGSGQDGWILAGINWAVANNVDIISMSLGAPQSTPGYSQVYETVAAQALRNGTLIIAAAGNDSSRPGRIRPVSRPANCPSIMAVGAIDSNLAIARFSNRGIFPSYGAIDIVGPGVAVRSAVNLPAKYATWNGTSMATPHVAGIAALWAQKTGLRGQQLWNKLTQTAKTLPHPASDDGAGLVQAPVSRMRIWPPRGRFPFPKYPFPLPFDGQS